MLSEGTNPLPNGVVPPTGKRFAARQSHSVPGRGRLAGRALGDPEDLVAMLHGVVQPPGRLLS